MGVGSGWGVRGHVPPDFQNFLGFSEKMNIFWRYEDFMDIFWGHRKFGLV